MAYDGVVSMDLETTGFSPTKNKILEIGVYLWVAKSNEYHIFERVINVGIVPTHITKITGITSKESKEGVGILSALSDLEAFIFSHLQRPLFVGHNLLKFDLPFLKAKYIAPRHVYDTMLIERAICADSLKRSFHATQIDAVTYRGNACVNLKMTCKRYKVKLVGAHRAVADSKATFAVMVFQLKRIGWKLFR